MISKKLVAASAEPLILSILARKESYGYAIIQEVRKLSNGEMKWTDGMLYPVLHRLERKNLIQSRWEESESARRRKYYFIKNEGKKALQNEQDQWMTIHSALGRLWKKKICLI